MSVPALGSVRRIARGAYLPRVISHDTLCVMREVTAAELRQAMGKVARGLARTGEPVLLKFGSKPVGVIVSLKDFEERFTLTEAADRRRDLMREILGDRVKSKKRADDVVRDLRER